MNGLSDPPGDPSTDTIRADVSCVICRSARFCGSVLFEPVKHAVLEGFATSRIFMACPGKYQSEELAGTNTDRVVPGSAVRSLGALATVSSVVVSFVVLFGCYLAYTVV